MKCPVPVTYIFLFSTESTFRKSFFFLPLFLRPLCSSYKGHKKSCANLTKYSMLGYFTWCNRSAHQGVLSFLFQPHSTWIATLHIIAYKKLSKIKNIIFAQKHKLAIMLGEKIVLHLQIHLVNLVNLQKKLLNMKWFSKLPLFSKIVLYIYSIIYITRSWSLKTY